MKEELDEILNYLNDDTARYACALVGEWGSGKTRFCMVELKNALKDKGWDVCRVSLFGVDSEEALHERILLASLNASQVTSNKKSGSTEGALHIAKDAAFSLVNKKLSEYGLSMNITSRMVSLLISGDNKLLVLDDLERSALLDNDDNLYGLINDLVEGRGFKVLLVTNSLNVLSPKMRDKIVWKAISYTADVAKTSTEILADVFCKAKDLPFSFEDHCIAAIKDSSCVNLRIITRLKRLLGFIASSDVLRDQSIDVRNREESLDEILTLVFQEAVRMYAPDTKVNDGKSDNCKDDGALRILTALQESRLSKLPGLSQHLKGNFGISQAIVDDMLKQYINKQHPESAADRDLQEVVDSFFDIRSMSSSDVEKYSTELTSLIRKAEFGANYMKDVVKINQSLAELGFSSALDDGELEIYLGKIIDKNPEAAVEALNNKYVIWKGQERANPVLDRLYERSLDVRKHLSNLDENGFIDLNDENCGSILANEMRNRFGVDDSALFGIEPNFVAKCFKYSNGQSQYALYRFFKDDLPLRASVGKQGNPNSRRWLQGIETELEKADITGIMESARLNWLLEGIRNMLKVSEDVGDDC